MKIHIEDRITKLEAAKKVRDAIPVAMVCIQPDGSFAFRLPEKLRGVRFPASELDGISDRYTIGTLIIDDLGRLA